MSNDLTGLLKEWKTYCAARIDLLESLNIPQSCRDPLSEFAEVLVAKIVNGDLASNRVQKGWDVNSPIGRVEVKYLSNPSIDSWVNWHTVKSNADKDWDWYALVVYLGFSPVAVYMFPAGSLGRFCKALGKRHGNQSNTLQFTLTNHLAISSAPEKFQSMGMKVHLLY